MIALISYVIVAVNECLHPERPRGRHTAGPRNRKTSYQGRRRQRAR